MDEGPPSVVACVDCARLEAELAAVNQELDGLTYAISHDLRAPLRAVRGFSEILVEEHAGELDDEASRLVGIIKANADKLTALIEGILLLSRVGRQELAVTELDMRATVESVVAELGLDQSSSGVDVTVGPLTDAPADGRLIRQVWRNLLGNAWKFSAASPRPHVHVDACGNEAQVWYRVTDNGVGFDMARAGRLFGAFERLHGDEFPGIGIGLAVVRRIVRRHGGDVAALGEPGRGATFSFCLPRKSPHLQEGSP